MKSAVLTRKSESAGLSKVSAKIPAPSMSSTDGLRIGESDSASGRGTNRIAGESVVGRGRRFGHDFSKVRVHTDTQRVDLAGSESDFPAEVSAAIEPSASVVLMGEAATNLRRAVDMRSAGILAKGPVRFRVPTTADMKVLFNSGSVPKDVLKDRVRLALTRMADEKRLKSTDSVDDIMKKVFPAAGGFDEAAYELAVDVSDRTKIYQSVLDAEAKVTSADKPKLKSTMQDAASLIDDCIADDVNLQSVFGTKKNIGKNVYKKAKSALNHAITHIDASVTTDYNLDDPETGLGGWATFSDQHVHFEPSVVKVTDEKEAKVTIIHESSHLADSTVEDKGYYGSHGFEGMSEDEKVTNAAHFEEIPRRKLGTSLYKDAAGGFVDFKPGTSAAGAPLTFAQKAKRKADEYLRKAWDKAVDVHEFVRDIRKAELAGNHALFNAHKARLLEISKLMHLTIHEQSPATATVNQVDVVLTEGVAHATILIQENAAKQPVFNPFQLKTPPLSLGFKPERPSFLPGQLQLQPTPGINVPLIQTEDEAAQQVIDASIKGYGALTGNDGDDKKLMDWLVAEYKKQL
jgi:hypothetical protein